MCPGGAAEHARTITTDRIEESTNAPAAGRRLRPRPPRRAPFRRSAPPPDTHRGPSPTARRAAAEVVPLALTGRSDRRGRWEVEPTLDDMRIGRRGISPVMIGRAGPLARLQGLVDGSGRLPVDDDIPAVALVAGEAGVGKTRLLEELASSVPPGTAVLVGQAEPGSLGRPLDVVRVMLGDLQTELVDARIAAIDVVTARLGERRSLVIFEDLHWADADSVGVFEQLAAMPRPDLTLVATYRPDELTSRLPGGDMLVRLERRRHVHQVRLERLDRYEVAAFV